MLSASGNPHLVPPGAHFQSRTWVPKRPEGCSQPASSQPRLTLWHLCLWLLHPQGSHGKAGKHDATERRGGERVDGDDGVLNAFGGAGEQHEGEILEPCLCATNPLAVYTAE